MQASVVYGGGGAFLAGVMLASYGVTFPWWYWVSSATAVAVLFLFRARFSGVGLIIVMVASATLGLWRFNDVATKNAIVISGIPVGEPVTVVGTVTAAPDVRGAIQMVTVTTPETNILITVDRYTPIAYGDVLSVTGVLEIPDTFITDLGKEFDYKGYLLVRGITHRMSFVTPTVIASSQGNHITSGLLSIKAAFLDQLSSHLPEPQAGLAAGMLLGVKRALGEELEEDFRTAGLTHIVVLSGYNILLVVAFVTYVLGFFFRWRVRVVVSIVAIVLFMVMVGLSASVLRAGSMAILMLMAMAIGRQYNVMRALLCVAVLMVYVNPYILRYDIGFQFSVMATLGLVIAMPHFETVLAKRPFLVSIGSFFWSTIATQIAVLPLLLYHIGAASVVSLIANVLVLPAVPLGMLLSFTVGVMGFIDPMLAEVSAFFAYLVLTYITILAAWAASVPFAVITVTYFPGFLVWIYYGTITIAISFYVYRQRYKIKTTSRCGEVAVTPVYFTRSDSLPRSN